MKICNNTKEEDKVELMLNVQLKETTTKTLRFFWFSDIFQIEMLETPLGSFTCDSYASSSVGSHYTEQHFVPRQHQ